MALRLPYVPRLLEAFDLYLMCPISLYVRTLQSDKITTLTNAAGVDVESIWAMLLAKALEGKDIKELLLNVGAGGGTPVGAVSAPVGGSGATEPAEAPKEEEKKEEKEESDEDMVCRLFFVAQTLTPCSVQGFGLFD